MPTAMTENIAPNSAAAGADQPGRPYYESLRTSLRGTIAKKRALDEQLAALEENIFKLETSYLEDTSGAGNIVRGFDNWVKGVVIGADGTSRRGDDKRSGAAGGRAVHAGRVRDEDRIFSNSSMSWVRAQEGSEAPSAAATPSHAPTPGSVFSATGTGLKKKKADRDEDDEGGKPAKRSKISYGRG